MQVPAILYKLYEPLLWSQIKKGPMPHHIGLIVDGNRRFAQRKSMTFAEGHKLGSRKLEDFLRWCWRLNIKIVTLYAFSIENHHRDKAEVDDLMNLILQKLKEYQSDPTIFEEGVQIKVIGKRENLSQEMIQEIAKIEEMTKDHDQFLLNIAVSYGGRAEIIDAVQQLVKDIKDQKLRPDEVSEDLFENYLYTEGLPDPDLIIRTSGEERLSGFLLWQSAYSELYFSEVYWPAFRMIDFWRAIRVYQQRERRFGK